MRFGNPLDEACSYIVGQPSFLEYYQLATRKGGLSLLSATNGVFQAGGVIGPLLLPWIADAFGRRASIATVSLRL